MRASAGLRVRWTVLGLVCSLPVSGSFGGVPANEADASVRRSPSTVGERQRELLADPRFHRGFILLAPEPGRRVPYGVLPGLAPGQAPVWDLAQWSSGSPLGTNSLTRLPSGALRHANPAKAITLGPRDSVDSDLSLAANASGEYGTRARKEGEPWVHLLAQQEIDAPPTLTELSALRLHVETRLKSVRKTDTPDDSPSLHAAQFQIFLTVQNRNRQPAGFGQYLWFGIPIYDSRHRIAPAHVAQDTAGSQMFIYTPAGDQFSTESAHDRQWLTIDRDLLPLLHEGLRTAWQRGFLRDSQSPADYRVTAVNFGWELPGIFDVEMQLRNLSLGAASLASP